MQSKVKILLVQLGSPKSPKVSHVRAYLREFLSDPRVVDTNPIIWKIILNLFILPFRPKKSAAAYARIWDGESFPLVKITESVKARLSSIVKSEKVEIETAYILSNPRIEEIAKKWEEEGETRASKWVVLPMFPQYCEGTTASIFDQFNHVFKKHTTFPEFHFVSTFHRYKSFIDAEVKVINEALSKKKFDALVMSFHGLPKRRVLQKGDPYYKYCYETYLLISERLKDIHPSKIHISFQSRFGQEEWLTPYTDELTTDLVRLGCKEIAIVSPSFLVDCLETIDELGTELKHQVEKVGGDLTYIPALNEDEMWMKQLGHDLVSLANSQPVEEYSIREIEKRIPACAYQKEPLSKESKTALKGIFLTLFLDLVGFSIIFPLFPAIADFYIKNDHESSLLNAIFAMLSSVNSVIFTHPTEFPIVLFGGFLGAVYSLLQFFFSPFWGTLSDRIGRKRSLNITVTGTLISYILWAFSSNFTLFFIARVLAGVMGGNISVASAAASDVTSKQNRSKAMAVVGIAFALGFILGPAIGGILSLIDLTKIEALSFLPLTPFSTPAIFAALLASLNLYLLKGFPAGRVNVKREHKLTIIPQFVPYKFVNMIGIAYFLYLFAFSGMEFTLAFLAVDRLGYSPKDNGMMFVWVGFILAMVQGGFVQRKAHDIGERKLALIGLSLIVPGLLLIAIAKSTFLLFLGLLFLACGSGMVIPTLSALTTFFAPEDEQGRAMGFFRSMGALARVFGPIAGSVIYWKFGSYAPYTFGAFFLVVPWLILFRVPKAPAKMG